MKITKMRDYNADYKDILQFLTRNGHTKLKTYLENNPPEMEIFGKKEILTIIPLTDALKEAHEKTNTMLINYEGNNLDNVNDVMGHWFSTRPKSAWRGQLRRK